MITVAKTKEGLAQSRTYPSGLGDGGRRGGALCLQPLTVADGGGEAVLEQDKLPVLLGQPVAGRLQLAAELCRALRASTHLQGAAPDSGDDEATPLTAARTPGLGVGNSGSGLDFTVTFRA